MNTVHHLKQSRSKRVLWQSDELSIAFALVVDYRDPQVYAATANLTENEHSTLKVQQEALTRAG